MTTSKQVTRSVLCSEAAFRSRVKTIDDIHWVKLMRHSGRSCPPSAFSSVSAYTLSPSKLHSAFFVFITSDLSLPSIAFFTLPLSSTLSPVRSQFAKPTMENCTLRTGAEVWFSSIKRRSGQREGEVYNIRTTGVCHKKLHPMYIMYGQNSWNRISSFELYQNCSPVSFLLFL